MVLVQYLIQGLALGVLYGLIALPMSLVWAATARIDMGVGGYAVVAGMAAATMGTTAVGIFAGLLLGLLGGAIAGAVFLLLDRKQLSDPITGVVATVGIVFAATSFAQWRFGSSPVFLHLWSQPLRLESLTIPMQTMVNVAVVTLVSTAVLIVLHKTTYGRVMKAVAANPQDAALVGIPVRRVQWLVVTLGGLLAGIAGVMFVATAGLTAHASIPITISAIGALIIFGMRGPSTALAGGLFLGAVESLSAAYLPSVVSPIVPMALVFVILASGIFDFSQDEARP